jgi:hypothetical protein
VSRSEFIRQLEELKLHGRRVFAIGIPLVLLFEASTVVYVLNRSRSLVHTQKAAFLMSYSFVPCLIVTVIFYLAIRHTVAKYAPSCPQCSAPISWRESASTLESGQCPHCKKELFRDS